MIFEMLGDNLLTLIKYYNYRGIPMALVKRLSRDILEALAFLHTECRIIHTDLKPENVLLSHHIPRLPKLQRSEYVRFNTQGASNNNGSGRNGQQASRGNGATDATAQLSRDEKKKLRKKQKKKQKKTAQSTGADDATAPAGSSSNGVQCDDGDSGAVPALTDALADLSTANRRDAPVTSGVHAELLSNFCLDATSDAPVDAKIIHPGGASERLRSSKVRAAAGVIEDDNGDDDDDDWVTLAPEFAARVMLLLPDGRVVGSRKREIEITIAVPPQHVAPNALRASDKNDATKTQQSVRTSFTLRYVCTSGECLDSVCSDSVAMVLCAQHQVPRPRSRQRDSGARRRTRECLPTRDPRDVRNCDRTRKEAHDAVEGRV